MTAHTGKIASQFTTASSDSRSAQPGSNTQTGESALMSDTCKTPGQQAAEAIRQAKAVLADPSKSQYHQRLSAAIDAMQGELDFWAQIAAIMHETH